METGEVPGAKEETKKCCSCGHWKSRKNYWRNCRTADGLQRRCKHCQRQAIKESVARRRAAGLPSHKRCPQCGETKPSNEFYRSAGRGDGLNPWCKSCTSQYHRRSFKQNPRRYRGYNLKRYGMRAEDYDHLRELQDGKCAICGRPDLVLNVDHCHATGSLRGLLCGQCNNGLGCFEDQAELLNRAKEYLLWWRRPEENNVYKPPEIVLRTGNRGTCTRTGVWLSICCGQEAEGTKGRPFPYCSACGRPASWSFVRVKPHIPHGPRPGWKDLL